MGRKSALTPEQWAQVEHRHIVLGEALNALAREFGVNESSLRRRISGKSVDAGPVREQLHEIAARKVQADKVSREVEAEIKSLPMVRQIIVNDLVADLVAISNHIASAGKYQASSAHRLSAMAREHLDKVDDSDMEKSIGHLKNFALFSKLATDAAVIPLNLLKANKDGLEEAARHAAAQKAADEGASRDLAADPMEASKEYQRIMGGA